MTLETVEYHTLNQGSFQMTGNAEDVTIFSALKGGTWEPHVVAAMERVVRPDSVCLDIGANIGALTVILARLAPAGRVYGFELSLVTSQMLARNVRDNHLSNVTVIHAAVGETEGEVAVHRIDTHLGFAHVVTAQDVHQEIVPAISIDEFRRVWNVARVDFIKLDVEGEEVAALAGMRRTIRECRPVMIVEYNPVTLEAFHGYPKRYLWDVLEEIYPQIAVIERETYRALPLASWEDLDRMLPENSWQDLICSFEPLE